MDYHNISVWRKNPAFYLKTGWKFSRPHTIIGTTLSVISLYLIASQNTGPSTGDLSWLVPTLISCLGCNIFIVGINQYVDHDLDKKNKPYLPIPAKEISRELALGISISSLISALLLAATLSLYFFSLIFLISAIGAAYSLPPFYLKRHHALAAMAIFLARGLLVNIGGYYHLLQFLQQPDAYLIYVVPLALFYTFFSIAIAWFKDIPDESGDREFNIGTLAVKYGPKLVKKLGVLSIILGYITLMISAEALSLIAYPFAFYIPHLALAIIFLFIAWKTNSNDNKKMALFYKLLWGFFFVEYCIYPLIFLI